MATNDFSSFSSVKPIGLIQISDDHPDVGMIKAFNKRLELLATIESRGSFYQAERHSPEETKLFDTFEEAFRFMPANSPQGVLAKLWVGLAHMGGQVTTEESRVRHDIIRRCDFNEVSTIEREMDFEQELVFGAIRDLTNQLKFRQEF